MKRALISLSDRRIWGAVYFSAVTALIFAFFQHWVYDDPFITYRYAENIAAGLGFEYNPGEPVLSTTAPLFALVLALAVRAGFDVQLSANLLGAASLAAGGLLFCVIAARLSEDRQSRLWIGITGLLLYPTFPLLVSTLGSETPLVLALCLAAIAAYLHDRYALSGALLGLALLTRGDSGILAAALVLDWLLVRREASSRLPWQAAAAGMLVITPWLVYGWLTFGSPLPVTLEAKQAQGFISSSVAFATGLINQVKGYGRMPAYWLSGLLSLAGYAFSIQKHSSRLVFLTWPLLYIVIFTMLGVTSYFWYYAPLIPGLIAAAGFGTAEIFKRMRTEYPVFRTGLTALGIVFIFYGQVSNLDLLRQIPDNRHAIYSAIGEWLATNTPEDSTIATLEIGMIGYYARPRVMIDFAGLIRPEIAEQFYQGYTFDLAAQWTAERYQPDYIVLFRSHYRGLHQNYISVRCLPAASFEGIDYGFTGAFDIYNC